MSHHCHDEHSHPHSHGAHSHGAHDHTDDLTPAHQSLLYTQLNHPSIRTLNESHPDTGRAICAKPWSSRLDPDPELVSDADAQLIIHVPFTGQVRLHSLLLRSSATPSAPRTLRLYANHETLDFDAAGETPATQTLELPMVEGVVEVPVKRALFGAVRHLALFFVDNWSGDEEGETRVAYLGFKGDFMKLSREPVEVLYEAAARPSDHKVEGVGVGSGVGFEGVGRRGM